VKPGCRTHIQHCNHPRLEQGVLTTPRLSPFCDTLPDLGSNRCSETVQVSHSLLVLSRCSERFPADISLEMSCHNITQLKRIGHATQRHKPRAEEVLQNSCLHPVTSIHTNFTSMRDGVRGDVDQSAGSMSHSTRALVSNGIIAIQPIHRKEGQLSALARC
jgi:hypothetical protein